MRRPGAALVNVPDIAADRVRLKIWDPLTGAVVYDTQPGADDASDPLTPLGGGPGHDPFLTRATGRARVPPTRREH